MCLLLLGQPSVFSFGKQLFFSPREVAIPGAPTFSTFCVCLTFSRWKITPHSPVAEIQLSPAELSRTSYGHLDSTVLEVNLNTPQMYDKTHPPYLPPLCWLNLSLVACNWGWNSTEINHYKAREWGRSHTYSFAYMGGSRYTDNSICKEQQLSSNLSIKSSPSERPQQWKSVNQRCSKIARVKC